MFYVSEIIKTAPDTFKTQLQEATYKTLNKLNIPFERVDTDPAITMEDCIAIDQRLKSKTVKTLFLCNRQKTQFYLFITSAEKPFVTKNFGTALGISRVSFASEELLLEILGTKIGAATIYGTLLDKDREISVVIDKEILNEEWYGCTDGTTTGYMKVKTKDIIDKFLPHTKHRPTYIEL